MKVQQFCRKQFIPASIEEVWDFFSSPANLKVITPPYMGFDVKTQNLSPKMHPGLIIEYTVKPLLSIPFSWVTEITHVNEPYFFVDEQRFGPYAFWHHQHHFKSQDGGVLMEDIVHYRVPLGALGLFFAKSTVEGKLNEIFEFRQQKTKELFG